MTSSSGALGWARRTGGVVREVLRNPALRNVLVAYLLHVSCLWGTWTAMLLWAVDALGTASVGVAVAVQLVPAAVFAAVAATLADRYPRNRVLGAGYLLQAAAFGAAGAGMIAGWPPVLVLGALMVAAAGTTMPRPAQGAFLPELARTPTEVTAANALVGTMEGLGILAGPLAAALILLVRGEGHVMFAGSAALLLATALVARLAPVTAGRAAAEGAEAAPAPADVTPATAEATSGSSPTRRSGPFRRIVRGLRAMAASGDVAIVVGVLGLRMLVQAMVDIAVVLLALNVFGIGGSGAGALQSCLGVGTLAGGAASVLLVGRRKLTVALAISAGLFGLPLVVLGAGAPVLLAPLLFVLTGAGFALIDVAGRTMLQRFVDPTRLATVLGSLEGVGLAGTTSGAVLAPLIIGAAGLNLALVVAGLLMPVSIVLAWVALRRIDRRANVPVREIALLQANPIFAPLPAPQLESVAYRTHWLTAPAGTTLIREGDPGDRYLVLVEGSLRVTQRGRDLRDLTDPGQGAGEIALLRGVPRTATVTASAPSVLLALARDDFLSAVTGSEPTRSAAEAVIAATDLGRAPL
jgi:MFS family permease